MFCRWTSSFSVWNQRNPYGGTLKGICEMICRSIEEGCFLSPGREITSLWNTRSKNKLLGVGKRQERTNSHVWCWILVRKRIFCRLAENRTMMNQSHPRKDLRNPLPSNLIFCSIFHALIYALGRGLCLLSPSNIYWYARSCSSGTHSIMPWWFVKNRKIFRFHTGSLTSLYKTRLLNESIIVKIVWCRISALHSLL